ncbi:MAG: branched-chain amino acid ABC transporter permease [Promethearchaeota archaeon]|nr:MAG: branched-chain amino acid ABC transporter permease [Candidatus Lokiarchaeota archaeon]
MTIIQVLISGAVFGSVLALLSSGYSLVYGVGGIINLSHGAFYLLTAYIIFWFVNGAILSYPIAIIAGLIIITIFGGVVYLAFIKPLEKYGEISILIVTFALAFVIERTILVYEGAKAGELLPIQLDTFIQGGIDVLGVFVYYQDIFIIIAAIVVLSFLIVFIKKSKLGKSIRAVSQDKDAAKLMGINVDRILMITVAFSAFLAGLSAILYVPKTNIMPYFGWDYLLLAMSVVILGGMGSLTGSLIGAYLISFIRYFILIYVDFPYGTAFAGITHLLIIVLVLIIRPRGLLGKKERV